MKVLQMISSAGFYGAERMMIQLSLSLEKRGCRTLLGIFEPHLEVAEQAKKVGLDVVTIPCHGRFDRRTISRIREITESFGADILHSHGYKPNMYAWLAAGTKGPKLVSTCHRYTDETAALRLYGWLDRRLLRRYHAVAVVSEEEEARLLASGVPRETVRVINNGIDCDVFAGAKPSLDRKGARFLVASVGRLNIQKNPYGFLQAARATIHSIPDARFLLVGDGPERTAIEQTLGHWNLDNEVGITGFLPDMPGVYASLDLLVLPSFGEGLPMTILEGMAAGVPVVATRVGAVEKVVRDGQTGILLPPDDQEALNRAILLLLQDRDLAQRLGQAGQRWVREHFSDSVMTDQYLRLYSDAGVSG